MRELKRVAAFVQRYGAPASLVYFDLDDLKAVNDRFGHAAGDAALKAVADRLCRLTCANPTSSAGWAATSSPCCWSQADLPTATGQGRRRWRGWSRPSRCGAATG